MLLEQGWLVGARRVPSPHYNCHPDDETPTLLVMCSISLPPGKFDSPWVDASFTGTIDPQVRPFFAEVARLRVPAHCLIRRDGEIVQYVPLDKRARHAGVFQCQGRERHNNFPIGIELGDTSTLAYTDTQHRQLAAVTRILIDCYPDIVKSMTSRYNIAPDRETDPGPAFNWARFRVLVSKKIT